MKSLTLISFSKKLTAELFEHAVGKERVSSDCPKDTIFAFVGKAQTVKEIMQFYSFIGIGHYDYDLPISKNEVGKVHGVRIIISPFDAPSGVEVRKVLY